jgi:hypothetical protein
MEGANRHDFKMARETLTRLPIERPEPTDDRPQGMWLDKGDDADEVRDLLIEFRFTPHIRARGEEAQSTEARSWVQGAAVGRGAHAQLDDSCPACADLLGQERASLFGLSAFGVCLHHL